MNIKTLSLDDLLRTSSASAAAGPRVAEVADTVAPPGIAIIGMSAQIGRCEDLASFWRLLANGQTATRRLPSSRVPDIETFLRLKGFAGAFSRDAGLRQSYLPEIDGFDYGFFGLSRQEANFADPNQRLFLQTAWAALEDAGYGGASIQGSLTGMYVGFSSDFGEDYRRIVHTCAPDAPEIAVAGNIKSIIGSRLAYHLDLHGPSVLVDTACSSGLTALHLACQALHQGDCTMALAGAVKLDLVPIKDDTGGGIGTKDIEDTIAADGTTKTFDDRCDGTSGAEGVLAFVLKPLARALADRDHIHAVIRGSAINQDGLSVGITAPNSAAQEAVILRALAVAGVPAESISYLEAHGTATRLGDPIEISGIQRAFRQQTDRRQFCAIGSVKTNLGHLDNAAGLAGLAKVVLALQHRELPASLHFTSPNRQIAFEHSPVYVNDRHRPWEPAAGYPRRAGINSFGLSGTNAHVLVEEHVASDSRPAASGPFLLPLSARTAEALHTLAERYLKFLFEYTPPAWRGDDLGYTAATGRRHHAHRLALGFDTPEQLRQGLNEFLDGRSPGENSTWWQGHFQLVAEERSTRPDALTEAAQEALTRQSEALRLTGHLGDQVRLSALARLYVAGAVVDWEAWFAGRGCRRLSLPTYPFSRDRCWVETTARAEQLARRGRRSDVPRHPLLAHLAAESQGLRLFTSRLSPDSHWELAEHQVQGTSILPGTCYVEMILAARAHLAGGTFLPLRLQDLQFLAPLRIQKHETREVHLQLREEPASWSVRILSRSDETSDDWEAHAEARWSAAAPALPAATPAEFLRELREKLPEAVSFARRDDTARGLEIGDRWNESFVAGWENPEHTEALVHLRLPATYAAEVQRYHAHPALLDTAVNALNHQLGEGRLYLPFAYRSLEVYRPLPPELFVHLRRQSPENDELIGLDLELYDALGQRCAAAIGYQVKRVPAGERLGRSDAPPSLFHAFEWETAEPAAPLPAALPGASVLLVRRDRENQEKVADDLRALGYAVSEIVIQTGAGPVPPHDSDGSVSRPAALRIGSEAHALIDALARLPDRSWSGLLYTAGLPDGDDPDDSAPPLPSPGEPSFDPLFHFSALIQGLLRHRFHLTGPLLVATRLGQTTGGSANASSRLPSFVPGQAALGALAQIAGLENQQLGIRIVDTDDANPSAWLALELVPGPERDLSVYRQGRRQQARIHSLEPPRASEPFVLDRRGVYLITGGTGALGLELAYDLATRGPRLRLALLGQSAVAEPKEWSRLGAHSNPRIAHRYQRLQALAEIAELECHALDVADAEAMRAFLEDLRQRRGPIRGVVHAAGRAGEGFLINKSPEQMQRVLDPKIAGAWLLHQLTLADDLQFFLLYSSIATVLHNPGQTDYTAANAFLNALAHYRRSRDLPALSLCWPAWREIGIAVDYAAVDEQEFFAPIATRTALDGLHLALAGQHELPPVVVLGEINARLTREQVDGLGLSLSPALLRRFKRASVAPTSGSAPASPRAVALRGLDTPDEFDRLVGQIWGETLAVGEIEVDTPFSDLGGNSILITQMFKAYESHHRGAMEMADLFSLTTIREQAAHLRRALRKKNPAPPATSEAAIHVEANVHSILDQLARGELSIEEASHFL